jgi:hypothetical protein
MAINNFIPQIWSARILESLRKALVYAQPQIMNRDYEGEINEAGDTVKINNIGDPTIFDYTKNSDMPGAETLNDSQKTLTITQAKAFNFQVDDVDKAQQQPKVMDFALSRAAYRLADITDQYVGAQLLAGATLNSIGTDALPIVAPTPTSGATGAYEQLVDLSVKLDEQNVPSEPLGRHPAVVPRCAGEGSALRQLRRSRRAVQPSGRRGGRVLGAGLEQRAHRGCSDGSGEPGDPAQGPRWPQHGDDVRGPDQPGRGLPSREALR